MGLRRVPPGGWPLDRLFVGVATLRTTRALFSHSRSWGSEPVRAWDLYLGSQSTPQGSTDSMNRLARLGLVTVVVPGLAGRLTRAPQFALDRSHPLVAPLDALFAAELALIPRQQSARRSPV